MPEKQLSHHESTMLFLNGLQNELAKARTVDKEQRAKSDNREMPPPQIRRSQKPKNEGEGENAAM